MAEKWFITYTGCPKKVSDVQMEVSLEISTLVEKIK